MRNKVQEIEDKIEERKKKYNENLDNKNYKIENKGVMPSSYLKDPAMFKAYSESDKGVQVKKDKDGDLKNKQYVNRSALVVDVPAKIGNQKVIKEGIKAEEANIPIPKPKKPPQSSQQEHRNVKTTAVPTTSNTRIRNSQVATGESRQAKLAAKRGSGILSKKADAKEKKKELKKEIEDVYNLPDNPNHNDSSDEDERLMNKPAMQLVAEIRAKKNSEQNHSAIVSKNQQINAVNNQKMMLPKINTEGLDVPKPSLSKHWLSAQIKDPAKSGASAQAKKQAFGQQKLGSGDLDDLLSGKPSQKSNHSQQKVDDDLFDELLNTNSKPADLKAAALPIQVEWKVENDFTAFQEESKHSEEGEDISDDDSLEDVDAAFNFTDTEFDANNRDDYTIETEILKAAKGTVLHEIEEEDELSEQTIQKKKLMLDKIHIEQHLNEKEKKQKMKWNHWVEIAGEETATLLYKFVCKKFNSWDDSDNAKSPSDKETKGTQNYNNSWEEATEEVQWFIAAHGISDVDNMAFDLFTIWSNEADIKGLREELEEIKERQELIE